MGYSRIETPYAGGPQTFPATFSLGYLNTADVKAYVQGEVDGSGQHAYRPFTWVNPDTILIGGSLPNPCVVVTERTVSKDVLTTNLGSGGEVTRSTIDRAIRQLMMVTHELMDGRVADFSEIDLLTGFVDAALAAKTGAEAQVALATAQTALATAARLAAQTAATTATTGASTATTKASEAAASAAAALASQTAADVTRGGNTPFTGNNSFAGTSTFTGAITAGAASTWNALATFVAGIVTGLINSRGGSLTIKNSAGTETHAAFIDGGSVSLYNGGTKKLETDAAGVVVTGRLRETARDSERWHGVSRAVGVWYQNTTGRLIRVAVTSQSSAVSGSVSLNVNDTAVAQDIGAIASPANGVGWRYTVYADVPNGHYYYIAVSGGASVDRVMELS